MTIKEISDIITAKKYLFQVSIPGTSFSHGKTTIEMALSDNDSLENYLDKIARINKAEHLFVKLFSPNGSSYKPKGEHLIFLDKKQPVASTTNVAMNVATTATSVADTHKSLNGQQEQGTELSIKPKNTTMDQKDYIDFKVLQSEHKRLEHIYDESKSKVKQLETKIEDLHEENKKLLRDNLTKEDKHELALERSKLEMERESKEGLSGLMGELTKDPDTLKMIVGFLKPDHPMFKSEGEQKALEGANDSTREIKYTEDSQTNTVLNDIPRVLSQKDGDTIASIYLLFQKLIADPDSLKQAVTTFLPEYTS